MDLHVFNYKSLQIMQGNHWVPWIHWTESHQFCGNKWFFLVNVGVALGNLLRCYFLLLLLSRFSCVQLCVIPWTAAHQAPHPWDSPGKNTGVGCHFLLQCMKVKSEVKMLSRVRLPETPWTAAHQAPLSMGFSRQEYWSGVPLNLRLNGVQGLS